MPLVEVISGPETEAAVVERAVALVRGIGKRPMLVERDVPGFVWNRLQLALLREAVWIVENGVAAPEVVDEIVRDGLARRWRYTGPFATAALGGPATFTKIAANLWPVLSEATEVHDLARWLIADPDRLAAVKAARDAGLLADLKRDQNPSRCGMPCPGMPCPAPERRHPWTTPAPCACGNTAAASNSRRGARSTPDRSARSSNTTTCGTSPSATR
jgi:hypothetical protein